MNEDPQGTRKPTPMHRLSDYDRQRLDEMNRANPAAFWLAYPVVVVGGMWLLIRLSDWWSSL
ncbi:hypothetical protein [Streptomyces sp. NPDC001816]|uniref:hypothetical protein n=1 Tax=Streptomyces sp. NPDC001816 TaxID=3364612 RepID=UPI0036A24D26